MAWEEEEEEEEKLRKKGVTEEIFNKAAGNEIENEKTKQGYLHCKLNTKMDSE